MDELVQYFESLLQYAATNARNLNAESQQALAQLIAQFQEIIEAIAQSEQIPQISPTEPELQESMPSSNVESFGYDDKTGRLLVRFLGKYPNRNGPIYGYEGVPRNIFEIFRKGAIPAKTDGKNKWGRWWKGKFPSMGAAMYHVIRAGGYQYQRLS